MTGGRLMQAESTALLNATAYNRADCVRLLLESGADKEARDIVREVNISLTHVHSFYITIIYFSILFNCNITARSLYSLLV